MAYPASIDTFPALADGDVLYADWLDAVAAAVVAIETALGTDPDQGALRPPVTPFLLMGA